MANEADTNPDLAAADRAAEALARSQGKGDSFRPEITPEREAALDDAFASIQDPANPGGTDEKNFGRDNGGVKPLIEGAPTLEQEQAEAAAEKAATDKAAADKAVADKAAADKLAAGDPPPGKPNSLLDDLAAPAADAPPADPFADVKLRSDASPKTRETFEQLKTVAKQREEAALKEAATAKQSLSELKTKVEALEKRTVPPETEAELRELRQFRAQFDTEHDPEFNKKFDARSGANYETIYSVLTKHKFPAAELEKLKGFSQEDRDAAIENLVAKLPGTDRKLVEAKLLDNVNVLDERERALQEARANADTLLAKQRTAPAQQIQQRDTAVAALLKPAVAKLEYLHTKEVPANATPDQKKQIEAHNAFAGTLVDSLRRAIVDDSPESRAEAAIAVPLAHYYKREFSAAKARADALQAKLDAIVSAGATGRTARSLASGAAPAPADKPIITDGSEAIDALFEDLQGARKT